MNKKPSNGSGKLGIFFAVLSALPAMFAIVKAVKEAKQKK